MESPTHATYLPRYCDFIRKSLPSWAGLTNEGMDFHLFSSLTNKVFKVTASSEEAKPQVVILRHFNEQEGVVDQDKEVKVFREMSKTGLGPACYGHEGKLRLEQYIPSRTIQAREYKEKVFRRKLARTMAALHSLNISDIDKSGLFESVLSAKNFEAFDKKCEADIYSPAEKETIKELKTASSAEEVDFLNKILPREGLVFSHNDLLSGNVLITMEKEDVVFIDYEYSSYNFKGFDIGNMFKEATFDYTYAEAPYFQILTSNFPNEEEFNDFLKYYITFSDMDLINEKKEKTDELIFDDAVMNQLVKSKYTEEDLAKKIADLKREAMIGVMLSFYYWFVWAVKMHKTSEAQFDYLEFAKVSHANYKKLKAELFSQ